MLEQLYVSSGLGRPLILEFVAGEVGRFIDLLTYSTTNCSYDSYDFSRKFYSYNNFL